MKKISILLIAGILATTANIAFAKPSKLSLLAGKTIHYQCSNHSNVTAIYYSLSDHSLSFVKLTLNGNQYTLPAVVSASGARYSDLRKIEWWEKGGTVTLNEDVNDSQLKIIECKEIAAYKNK
jgi:membrane-bound inhibitor of C-type lysozyme